MAHTPKDDRSAPPAPTRPLHRNEPDDAAPVKPITGRDDDGQARDQGDQTEDNKRQQE